MRQYDVACQRYGERVGQEVLEDRGIKHMVARGAEKLNDRSAWPGIEPCRQRMRAGCAKQAHGILCVNAGCRRWQQKRNQPARHA